MGLAKTVALVIVAGAAGSMISGYATPRLMTATKLDAKHTGAVSTGVTAGSAAAVFILLSSVL
jgi:hypothetical protein